MNGGSVIALFYHWKKIFSAHPALAYFALMMHLKNIFLLLLMAVASASLAQNTSQVSITVANDQKQALSNATVELFGKKDSSLVKAQMTDSTGKARFTGLSAGDYFIRISLIGHLPHTSTHFYIPDDFQLDLPAVSLQPSSGTLAAVTVAARKPFIELKPGRTIINVESGITTTGTTAMEALEKMPGITVDKDGNISLKGRAGVTIMIDGKPTYLDPAQLANLLNGMSASQISQVEIMDQPSAKYDAAGNAGLINIKIKKNNQKGFNGSFNTSYGQGFYPKNNNNLQLNYRSGPFNLFFNYSYNNNHSFTRIYALRKYFENDGTTIAAMLEQPSFLKGIGSVHNLRTGIDYSINEKTNIGLTLSGLALSRSGNGNNTAVWMAPNGAADSLIETQSSNHNNWKNAGVNFNFRHAFTANRDLTADMDIIGYRIKGDQFFENNSVSPVIYSEASRATIPSTLRILSAKVDYAEQIKKWKLETGVKTSRITTDNLAAYEFRDGAVWKEDAGKTNHFLYNETIHALYADAETKMKKWSVQGGLRYELTGYDAHQLGNTLVKDSSFSRKYGSLFPTAFVSFEADSFNSFSLTAGRRIDRPAFQKLNPFLFIINKYTYQQGNPFYRPQYTWNIGLSHSYKNMLITSLNYGLTHDYFSQIFPVDSNGIVIYTEGNLKRLQHFSASVMVQLSPATWWSLSAQAVLTHKKMEGFIEKQYLSHITQVNMNFSNQLRFKKGWSAELSGFYTSKSQNDIQEFVDPAGQVSVGAAKTILKNKGTIRLAARDIFYTQWMKGLTHFTLANEYFKLTRDTRVVTISFSYRFGKAFKAARRSQGAAGEEIERVGNG
jgi:hypothetical protein